MQKASGVQDKTYKNLEFLNGREARTIHILSAYAHPKQRFEEEKIQNTVEVSVNGGNAHERLLIHRGDVVEVRVA